MFSGALRLARAATLDTGAASITIAANFFGVPADYGQLRHRFAQDSQVLSVADMLRGLRSLGLKARLVSSKWARLGATPTPSILVRKDGSFAVLGKVADDKALVMDPTQEGPSILARQSFEDAWSGRLILVAKRDAPTLAELRFGIGWFVSALGQYKKIFSEVVVASFFIQLFALLSPLFFQVIIDKDAGPPGVDDTGCADHRLGHLRPVQAASPRSNDAQGVAHRPVPRLRSPANR